jgi:CheY-like chemotaxis protein
VSSAGRDKEGRNGFFRLDNMSAGLILSDLRMPKMDGAMLYQALQDKYGPAMPRMIFVTGQAYALEYAGFLDMAAAPFSPSPSP